MRTVIIAGLWVVCNALGIWVISQNLGAVGRLGLALVGCVIVLLAWTCLVTTGVVVVMRAIDARRTQERPHGHATSPFLPERARSQAVNRGAGVCCKTS